MKNNGRHPEDKEIADLDSTKIEALIICFIQFF